MIGFSMKATTPALPPSPKTCKNTLLNVDYCDIFYTYIHDGKTIDI